MAKISICTYDDYGGRREDAAYLEEHTRPIGDITTHLVLRLGDCTVTLWPVTSEYIETLGKQILDAAKNCPGPLDKP